MHELRSNALYSTGDVLCISGETACLSGRKKDYVYFLGAVGFGRLSKQRIVGTF